MEVNVAEQSIEREQTFGIMTYFQFVGHAHATMELYGCIGNKPTGLAHLSLEHERVVAGHCIISFQRGQGILKQTLCALVTYVHVRYTVLQDLKCCQ